MTYKIYAVSKCAALGVALALASSQAFGGPAVTSSGVSAAPHSAPHRSVHRVPNRALLPVAGGYYYGGGVYNRAQAAELMQPLSGDFTYTYKMDVPWDWAHRYPPGFLGAPTSSSSMPARAYVPGCPAQSVTVPGADGKDQTVSIVRSRAHSPPPSVRPPKTPAARCRASCRNCYSRN
jgi:hypothetical protein